SLELQPELPAPDRCGSCTRCIDACPTQALTPYQLDSRRCIAYLTIEKRGEIPEEFRDGIGRHVFGCDICQDVCPWNQRARQRSPAAGQPIREDFVNPELERLASMTEADFRRVFRGTPIKRTKFSGFRRNVAIAMGNSGEGNFLPRLQEWSGDADASVAEHARWAAEKLKKIATDWHG